MASFGASLDLFFLRGGKVDYGCTETFLAPSLLAPANAFGVLILNPVLPDGV